MKIFILLFLFCSEIYSQTPPAPQRPRANVYLRNRTQQELRLRFILDRVKALNPNISPTQIADHLHSYMAQLNTPAQGVSKVQFENEMKDYIEQNTPAHYRRLEDEFNRLNHAHQEISEKDFLFDFQFVSLIKNLYLSTTGDKSQLEGLDNIFIGNDHNASIEEVYLFINWISLPQNNEIRQLYTRLKDQNSGRSGLPVYPSPDQDHDSDRISSPIKSNPDPQENTIAL